MLTPRKSLRLLGLPDTHKIPDSDDIAYQQISGPSVVPVTQKIARAVLEKIDV